MNRARWAVIAVAVIATLGIERLIHHEYDYWFTGVPGFYAIFGFVGCVAIIYLSKWFGRLLVQRDEDYYDRHGDDDPHGAMSSGHRPPHSERSGRRRAQTPVPPREEEA